MISDILNKEITILVIGDIILDHFVYGSSTRISPEAPVPVVEAEAENDMLGGCGNVINNLINLNSGIELVTSIGKGINSEIILEKLKTKNIDSNGIFKSHKIKTNYKMRIVANNQHVVRVDWDNKRITKKAESFMIDKVLSAMDRIDGVIISDYNKGVCSKALLSELISVCKRNKKPIFVDPKGTDWSKYSSSNYITPNIHELSSVLDRKLFSNNDFEEAGKEIIKNFNIDTCLITRGKEGMTIVDSNDCQHVSSKAKEVYDVSGAGDTVIACFAMSVLAGYSKISAMDFANKAAGIVVGHLGTSAIKADELI